MSAHGPPIESLLHRLAETPQAFLAEPVLERGGEVHVDAVVFDVVSDLGHTLDSPSLEPLRVHDPTARNWLRLVLIGAWLAHDPAFRGAGLGPKVARWLTEALHDLARLVEAELYVTDAERREELARLLLAAVELTPQGESPKQAADRLATVDSIERTRVLEAMREKRERAEQLRRELAAKKAREAAARFSRE